MAGKQEGSTLVRVARLSLAGNTIELHFDNRQKITRFDVNSSDVLKYLRRPLLGIPSGGLVPNIIEEIDGESTARSMTRIAPPGTFLQLPSARAALVKVMQPLFHGNTSTNTIRRVIEWVGIGEKSALLTTLKETRSPGIYWQNRVSQLKPNSFRLRLINDLNIASWTPFLFDWVASYVKGVAGTVRYIAPVRAPTERYYRPQNLSVHEVDYQGKNLAILLRTLTDTERRRLSEWTDKYLGISLSARSAGGHLSLTLRESLSGPDYNLTDVGFGFSQIAPIVTQLWLLTKSGSQRRKDIPIVFSMEQPELHLHPHLQATVADLLIGAISTARANGLDLRLIIETHSEAIINRLGHRIATEELSRKDVSVVLFHRKQPQLSEITVGSYDVSRQRKWDR
jgi:hypothetical protein